MKHITEQNIAILAGITVLCALALLSLGFPGAPLRRCHAAPIPAPRSPVREIDDLFTFAIIIAGCPPFSAPHARVDGSNTSLF